MSTASRNVLNDFKRLSYAEELTFVRELFENEMERGLSEFACFMVGSYYFRKSIGMRPLKIAGKLYAIGKKLRQISWRLEKISY